MLEIFSFGCFRTAYGMSMSHMITVVDDKGLIVTRDNQEKEENGSGGGGDICRRDS